MNVATEIAKLPPNVQQEVYDYVEFLSRKYQQVQQPQATWLKNIKRGKSSGTNASDSVIVMRSEEKC